MVKLAFVIKDGSLTLRISEGQSRYYKCMNSVLVGKPNVERHWIAKKERFAPNAVNAAINNRAIEDVKKSFLKVILENPTLSADEVAHYFSNLRKKEKEDAAKIHTLDKFLDLVIEREKIKEGRNFEVYVKLQKKCRKLIPDFEKVRFVKLTYDVCARFASIFSAHKGYRGTAKSFRAMLGRAHKDPNVEFEIKQIGGFSFAEIFPEHYKEVRKEPDVLSREQVRLFIETPPHIMTPKADATKAELYWDVCVFMLHSFLAPCDVVKLRADQITKNGTIKTSRKKTHRDVEIPITPAMWAIIKRYEHRSPDGFVFPILDGADKRGSFGKEIVYKKFDQALNIWLKYVGTFLRTKFPLYAYVFRHTAITIALDSGLSLSYVSMVAGTSMGMIERHYYNGNNQQNHNRLQSVFMSL